MILALVEKNPDGTALEVSLEALTFARGLRSIMEGILLETMYDLPGLDSVEQVVIGPEVVEGKAKPLFIHGERNDQAASASA